MFKLYKDKFLCVQDIAEIKQIQKEAGQRVVSLGSDVKVQVQATPGLLVSLYTTQAILALISVMSQILM